MKKQSGESEIASLCHNILQVLLVKEYLYSTYISCKCLLIVSSMFQSIHISLIMICID